MKKMKEKGFTLVELVIVIAVIAILAAILIPTFSTLIRKSSISSDIVLAKNLNTAVSLYKGETGKTDIDFAEALKATNKNGFVLSNLNAKAKDSYFVWDDNTDQFLFVEFIEMNGEKPVYKVLYSNDENYWRYDNEIANPKENEHWVFATSDIQNIEETKGKFVYAKFLKVVTEYSQLSDAIKEDAKDTIYFNNNIEFSENDSIVIDDNLNDGKTDIVLDLNGSTLQTKSSSAGSPILVTKGKLTIANGTLKNDDKIGIEVDKTGQLDLKNMNIECQTYLVDAVNYNEATNIIINIEDSVIKIASPSNKSAVKFQEQGNITFTNTVMEALYLFEVSYGSTITINSGQYKSRGKILASINNGKNISSATTIIINGGNFNFTEDVSTDKTFMFNFYGSTSPSSDNCKVIISGGRFNNVDYETYFDKYINETEWANSIKNFQPKSTVTCDVIITKEFVNGKAQFTITRKTK